MPQQHRASLDSMDVLPDRENDTKDDPIVLADVEGSVGDGKSEHESVGDDDINTIISALEKKARFLASEIEVVRLNGAMTEKKRKELEMNLHIAVALLNKNIDDCYKKKEIDEDELKKNLASSWGVVESYLKDEELSTKVIRNLNFKSHQFFNK